MPPLILDLCGGSGSWSQPFADAGYCVINVTLPAADVREYKPPPQVFGVLAAPPCNDFAVSGAQYWKQKDKDGRTLTSLEVVTHCLRIIAEAKPVFWAIENPVGRLKRWLGEPRMYFNPCDFGDPYTKKTCLWGNFRIPKEKPVKPVRVCKQGSWIQKLGGKSAKTKYLRSITPPGFAKAFFEANNGGAD